MERISLSVEMVVEELKLSVARAEKIQKENENSNSHFIRGYDKGELAALRFALSLVEEI